jgi:hypothetical protein
MRAPLRPPQPERTGRLGALQRLDLALLIHAQDDRVLRWVQIQANHIADLALQLWVGGELERLRPPGPDLMLSPHPRNRGMADTQLGGQEPRRPVRDPQPVRRRRERGSQDRRPPASADGLRATQARAISKAGQPFAGVPAAPGDHGRARDTELQSDLRVGHSLGGKQQHPRPLHLRRGGRGRLRPATQDSQVVVTDHQRRRGEHAKKPPRAAP